MHGFTHRPQASPASHHRYSRSDLTRLIRYGLTDQEIATLAAVMQTFHCPDTCGRRRHCLDILCLAAQGGDPLAVKLLTTSHRDRMMDNAAIAYGRALAGASCPAQAEDISCDVANEDNPPRQAHG
jgi:hypothetical protein